MSSTPSSSSGRHHAARIDPIRCRVPLLGHRRASVEADRSRLLAELDRLDDELAEIAARRAAVAARLAELRERLWPADLHRRGRRPGATGAPALPPLPPSPTWLYGRRLRSVCLALLRRAGRQTLGQLHALLHAHGYGVDSSHATKALSDALAYEVECGRARRVRRGEYECMGPRPRTGRHGAPRLREADPTADDDEVAADRLLDEVLTPASSPDGAR